jgi:hypothetical protein
VRQDDDCDDRRGDQRLPAQDGAGAPDERKRGERDHRERPHRALGPQQSRGRAAEARGHAARALGVEREPLERREARERESHRLETARRPDRGRRHRRQAERARERRTRTPGEAAEEEPRDEDDERGAAEDGRRARGGLRRDAGRLERRHPQDPEQVREALDGRTLARVEREAEALGEVARVAERDVRVVADEVEARDEREVDGESDCGDGEETSRGRRGGHRLRETTASGLPPASLTRLRVRPASGARRDLVRSRDGLVARISHQVLRESGTEPARFRDFAPVRGSCAGRQGFLAASSWPRASRHCSSDFRESVQGAGADIGHEVLPGARSW